MPQSNTAPRHANENARTPRQPVDKFTDGHVQVSIWENEGVKGAFRAATIQLRYKDGNDWKTGTSYGPTDLEHLETAAREARRRIREWQQESRGGSAPKHAA
jgi:hypothetical protein